ncbi:MAG: Hpt domain-containing protein [Erysipelotrichaceae bacterium]|nr:Hpt domain-containing protein [Erysipelotrichaceae bacterium]
MLTIEGLREFGADVEEGLGRCFGQEEFYLTLVGMVLEEKNFDVLQQAIKDRDLDKAFEAAHALKGVLGNLSLTPVLKPVEEITELLRSRTDTDYEPLLQEILNKKNVLVEMAAQ